jgi:high-affinity Fe2+/Pb2+ permease
MTRAQRSLVILTGVTVLSAGLLAQALAAPPGVGADVLVAVSLLLLLVSATLLVRVLRYLARAASAGANSGQRAQEADAAGREQ